MCIDLLSKCFWAERCLAIELLGEIVTRHDYTCACACANASLARLSLANKAVDRAVIAEKRPLLLTQLVFPAFSILKFIHFNNENL